MRLTSGVGEGVSVGDGTCVRVAVGGMGEAVSVKGEVGGADSVSVDERSVGDSRGVVVGLGVCVADGTSVFAGWGIKAAVGIDVASTRTVGPGAGARNLFATDGPNMAETAVNVNNTNDAISHCQPVTIRARRVR